MHGVLVGILALNVATAFAQTATISIEVRNDDGPLAAAGVFVNGTAHKTNAQGIALVTVPAGHVDIVVVKDGFAPASASVDLPANQQQPVVISRAIP
jgi:hypothetical protein